MDIFRHDEHDQYLDIYDAREFLERIAKQPSPHDENEVMATALLRLIEHIPNMRLVELRHIIEQHVVLDRHSTSDGGGPGR